MVFISLTLSVFSTIEGYEITAGDILFYVESVVVVWFGVEFGLRWFKSFIKSFQIYYHEISDYGRRVVDHGIKDTLVDSNFWDVRFV